MMEETSKWGHLESSEKYGRETHEYILIDKDNPDYKNFQQASHCMVYAETQGKAFGLYDLKAIVLMQMRFDGYLGFVGGLVDEGETPLEGLNREIKEEMNWIVSENDNAGPVTENDYMFTHFSSESKLVLHFYAIQVNEEQIRDIEKGSLNAKDYGEECLGVIRVPLYTMGDGYRGLPSFLNMNFAGNSKSQLLDSLKKLGVLTKEYVEKSISSRPVPINSVWSL